ncbi:sugar ABC transporter ATP-binding protein (plasmid) [Halostagnicola larsenii XH-48]|uniref:ABC-type D-xylose/L-arabinose transporter n=1 Tax=Halostagnicola larsenii XH-48 TaxID=797299 RepID=W0JYY1_9EURY|nr:sn-glycerol-3-phosphate ABC transporter ATP-binding protein UgpC [Halostagnicola larsenii]AHG02208.1 sugar ABC transporter ATP-binding protein [Halostagnicola larsenii XH-48]
MAQTKLNDVTKIFTEDDGNEIVAVDDVSIDIEDGEFLVLVGPSGCGKSTTLRMVAGLETISSGEITLDDRVINDTPAKDRDIAMVFQSYALYPHMTVGENMSFGLEESTDLEDDEISERVEETATMMGIEELLDRKPGELSGGQQQRVALGRAIVRDPAVFLMDEPLSNLDAKLRAEMRTELQRLQEELDTTTVYVTHDQTEAMTMGDRVAILNDGTLQQIGTPLNCYHRPANLFVAGFVGEPSMNFIDMERHDEAGTTVLHADLFEYPISDELATELGDSSDLVLGIRPEDIEISTDSPSGEHDIEATIDVIEPMGDENIVYLQFENDDTSLERESIIATVGGMRQFESGQTVTAHIPEGAIHIFDGSTGEALHNRRLEPAESQTPQL